MDQFPVEILSQIFECLALGQIVPCMRVCKTWNLVIERDPRWRTIVLGIKNLELLDPRNLPEYFCRRLDAATSLTITRCPEDYEPNNKDDFNTYNGNFLDFVLARNATLERSLALKHFDLRSSRVLVSSLVAFLYTLRDTLRTVNLHGLVFLITNGETPGVTDAALRQLSDALAACINLKELSLKNLPDVSFAERLKFMYDINLQHSAVQLSAVTQLLRGSATTLVKFFAPWVNYHDGTTANWEDYWQALAGCEKLSFLNLQGCNLTVLQRCVRAFLSNTCHYRSGSKTRGPMPELELLAFDSNVYWESVRSKVFADKFGPVSAQDLLSETRKPYPTDLGDRSIKAALFRRQDMRRWMSSFRNNTFIAWIVDADRIWELTEEPEGEFLDLIAPKAEDEDERIDSLVHEARRMSLLLPARQSALN